MICPEVERDEAGKPLQVGTSGMSCIGPDNLKKMNKNADWEIKGKKGDKFMIDLYRNPEDPSDMSLTWTQSGSEAPKDPDPRFFVVAQRDGWGATGDPPEMGRIGASQTYACDFELRDRVERFRILAFMRDDM